MLRAFLFLLALIPGILHSQQFCEGDLNGETDKRVRELFDVGLDNERLIRGYVGITHAQMRVLAKGGSISFNQWEHRALFAVHSEEEHDDLVQQTAKWATRESLIQIVRDRILRVPDSSPRALAFVPAIIDSLIAQAKMESKAPREINATLENMLVAFKNLEIGHNLPTEKKLRRMINWVAGRTDGLSKIGPRVKGRFLALFGKLPIPSGYVLGLNGHGVHNIPGQISLKDVAGIEPLSQSDYNFLSARSYD